MEPEGCRPPAARPLVPPSSDQWLSAMQPVTIVYPQCWSVAGRTAGSLLKLLPISPCCPCAFACTSSSALGGAASPGHILFVPSFSTDGTRLAWPATRAGGSQLVRVHYDCPSVFPVCVLVRRCQARSCLLQNLAPTDAVLCLLHLFWIRLAWPVRWTNTRI